MYTLATQCLSCLVSGASYQYHRRYFVSTDQVVFQFVGAIRHTKFFFIQVDNISRDENKS
ncbi:hypothetical protein DERF_012729 [Dermatophagoides farinae]|uniref:Uncharacterized protein n=1 Tax=Dermatophagoides farinae TaxID=6954 RepID=A0A922L209_DERFA|nr:hypothetical protein DERF_012729 [Dermatophagoides farinae]